MRVTALFSAYSEGISGGDLCFIEIAKRRPDWNLTVVTSALGRDLCREHGLEARFLLLSREATFSDPIRTYALRAARGVPMLRRERADVFYATSDFLPDTLLARYLRTRNPHSVWVQKVFHLIPKERVIPHHAQRASLRLIRSADKVITDNQLLSRELDRYGIHPQRVSVNYPGIDVAYFSRLPEPRNKTYAGAFLARLAPSKGIADLVPIWERVIKRLPSAKLAVIGRGEPRLLAELRARVRDAGLANRVEIFGHLPKDRAFEIVKSSEVFLVPSREEGFGIAALEAIAAGLPVVAYDLPVFAEVFSHGMIRVPIGDVHLFADEVATLLQNTSLRSALVQDTARFVERFAWETVAAREAEAIEGVLRRSREQPQR